MARTQTQDTVNERNLPASLDCERYVLAACMQDEDHLTRALDSLTREDFSLEKHMIIFDTIRSVSQMGFGVDRRTVIEALMVRGDLEAVDGMSYIVSLDEGLPKLENVSSYIEIIKEKASLRRLIYIADELEKKAIVGRSPAKVILRELDDRLYNTFRTTQTSDVVSLSEFVESYPGGINKLLDPSQTEKGIPTGFERLDELTCGIYKDEVWVVGASPRVGKTAWALQVGYNAARKQKIPVLMFSMESSKAAIHRRLLCAEARVSVPRFKSGDLNQEERLRTQEANAIVMETPFHIDDTRGQTVHQIRRKVERAIDRRGIGLVILDFLQLPKSSNPRHNNMERITEVCLTMQDMAGETHVPVILLSQLSRGHLKAKQKPSLEDFRDSGAIEQVANVGILLHREELTNKNKPELRGKAEFLLEKNKDGESSDIPMRYIKWLMRFEDVETTGRFSD